MSNTPVQPTQYQPTSTYYIYNKKSSKGGCGCGKKKEGGCDDCKQDECTCGEKKDCGCCPPGLVSVFDDNNTFIGCLTPADAELYVQSSLKCNDGYLKLFVTSTGQFLGCVSAIDYATIYPLVNG